VNDEKLPLINIYKDTINVTSYNPIRYPNLALGHIKLTPGVPLVNNEIRLLGGYKLRGENF